MLKPKPPNTLLNPNLHLRIRQMTRKKPPSPSTRNKHIRLDPALLSRFSNLNAQIMVDPPLILDPPRRRPRSADGIEDDVWTGRQGGDHAAPFRHVAFLDRSELGGLRVGKSAGDGRDG